MIISIHPFVLVNDNILRGQVMKLILYHTPETRPMKLARAISEKMIIYVSRVKLFHRKPGQIYQLLEV